MAYHALRGPMWLVCMLLVICIPLVVMAQQTHRSPADLVREGPLALAAANDEKPRYGGTFLGVLNEKIPFYDMHQTSPEKRKRVDANAQHS